jgi:hypothetical protein
LGPIDFQQVYLGLQIDNDGIPLEISASLSAELGPVVATIDRMGLETRFSFPEGGGNLGPIDFDIGFKFPSGIGLSVNAGGITGGGFLKIDPPNYAGVLELSFQERIELTAFGLLTTKLPDGQVFLVISILAQFNRFNSGLGFASPASAGAWVSIASSMGSTQAGFQNTCTRCPVVSSNPIKCGSTSLQTILPPRQLSRRRPDGQTLLGWLDATGQFVGLHPTGRPLKIV